MPYAVLERACRSELISRVAGKQVSIEAEAVDVPEDIDRDP